jgi:hypothetical protein
MTWMTASTAGLTRPNAPPTPHVRPRTPGNDIDTQRTHKTSRLEKINDSSST